MKPISCTAATALAVFTFAPFVLAEEKSPDRPNTVKDSAKAVPVGKIASPSVTIISGNGTVTAESGTITGGGVTATARAVPLANGPVSVESDTVTGEGGTIVITGSALIETGPVTWLGLATDALSAPLAAQLPIAKGTGLLISHVTPESPAQRAGLEANDVLIKFDDQLLTNPDQLRTLVRTKKAGDSVKFSYYRKGALKEVTASLITKELTAADGNAPSVIEFQSSAIKADDLIKGLKSGGSRMTIEKKAFVVGPDGKMTGQVSASAVAATREEVIKAMEKAMEAMKKSGASEEVLKSVEKALRDTMKEPAVTHRGGEAKITEGTK